MTSFIPTSAWSASADKNPARHSPNCRAARYGRLTGERSGTARVSYALFVPEPRLTRMRWPSVTQTLLDYG